MKKVFGLLNNELDYSNKYYDTKEELEDEVRRVYLARLNQKIELNTFIGLDNLGNRHDISLLTPLLFKVVKTPDSWLYWWVNNTRVIPVYNIEPVNWVHPEYFSYMYETFTCYHISKGL